MRTGRSGAGGYLARRLEEAPEMFAYPSRRHLRVLDVMTFEVVTADPLDGFKEVAQRLYTTGVSALPVIDNDRRVVGVVSESDLLVKEGGIATGSVFHPKRSRQLTAKARATSAAEAMSQPAVTITVDATVAEAARVMLDKRVKRLPVVDSDGRLLGMVSRHDLIQVFVRTDASIRDEVTDGVLGHDLRIDSSRIEIEVAAGIVHIAGEVERRSEVPIITILVSAIDGVVAVDNTLTFAWDDTQVESVGPIRRSS